MFDAPRHLKHWHVFRVIAAGTSGSTDLNGLQSLFNETTVNTGDADAAATVYLFSTIA